MNRTFIGLGSNVGDRMSYLRQAVAELSLVALVDDVSSVYRADPVGPPQPDFFNAVVCIRTNIDPWEMLAICTEIERDLGRIKRGRWQQREIDLDIVAMDGIFVAEQDLTVPHALASERGFVLVPLCEIDPTVELAPGLTAGDALEKVGSSGVEVTFNRTALL